MIDTDELLKDGKYFDRDGINWIQVRSSDRSGHIFWTKEEKQDVWYSVTQFKKLVIMDQMKKEDQADALERAARSGAFGTTAQSTLLLMADKLKKGTLRGFLDSNGCRW